MGDESSLPLFQFFASVKMIIIIVIIVIIQQEQEQDFKTNRITRPDSGRSIGRVTTQ